MSKSAYEIQAITTAQFDKLLKEKTPNKWSDLEINKVYTFSNTMFVDNQNGESMVLTLLNNGERWAPDHLKHKISDTDLPLYRFM